MRSRTIAAAMVLALFLAACSEPAPVDTTEAPAADTGTTDASDNPADSDEAAAEADESAAEAVAGQQADSQPAEPDDSAEPEATAETDDQDGADDAGSAESDAGESAEEEAASSPAGGPAIAAVAGEPWFLGTIPDTPVSADTSLEPIKIGMINLENTPFGSFPEVRSATQAAVALINAELGGVEGRPIELLSCITAFDPQASAGCAQELVQEGVVALVGGVDISSNGSFPVIEQNELPMVGGIPAGLVEQRSEFAFSFSGGGAGAAAAFMQHAAAAGAQKVLLAYGEFEPFEVAARDYAAVVGESLGLEVELVAFSLFATDYLPILTKAQQSESDAVIVLAADTACLPIMQNMNDLDIDAQLYLTGACASDALIEAAGEDILGVLFNAEGPLEPSAEGTLYGEATTIYATEPAGGAGTVGFRSMMNLWGLLSGLGADNISSASILAAAQSTVNQPSFWGHPYTCDGNQVPGLPALCAPQQVLFEVASAGADPTGVGDWIDTADLFAVIDG